MTRHLYILISLLGVGLLLLGCGGTPSTLPGTPSPTANSATPNHEMPSMNHEAGVASATPAASPTQGSDMAGMSHEPMPGEGDASMDGGHDMSPVDLSLAKEVSPHAEGNQLLESTLTQGVKEFDLTVRLIRWSILPEVVVGAYAYNDQVPGPLIRVLPGDNIRVRVTNELEEPTSIHWHGLVLPNDQDGAAGITQEPISPGHTYTYEYTVPDTPGTYFYHTHVAADRQQALGLYGAFIIDEPTPSQSYDQEVIVALGEWRVVDGHTWPAMELEGMLPNFFTINGKSYPATETVEAKVGDRLLFRFIGSGQFIHPMHIHGGPFEIVGTDGNPVPAGLRLKKDTLLIGPGERYDVIWTAQEAGRWLVHCHISHHTTNNGAEVHGGGGLTMLIHVAP